MRKKWKFLNFLVKTREKFTWKIAFKQFSSQFFFCVLGNLIFYLFIYNLMKIKSFPKQAIIIVSWKSFSDFIGKRKFYLLIFLIEGAMHKWCSPLVSSFKDKGEFQFFFWILPCFCKRTSVLPVSCPHNPWFLHFQMSDHTFEGTQTEILWI